ncbi:hypothetical protein QBC47DRAFT_385211 [Echria macrotheca]|uniref:Uncharacterized protein n=1 Tax=Echria macrotheca TaxID=438768 RepID=A0AAJ0B9W3_9PEZI|nr:hypothetical protein QBC47DRAFT_385211 [Echria macrotheca]
MTVTIRFDDLAPGTIVTNQFESKGILFTSPAAVVRDPDTFVHSLQSRHQSTITPQPTRVIRARFVEPSPQHARLSVVASFSNAGPEGVHALLRVFDAAGRQLDERSFGSTGPVARAEIEFPSPEIASFEVSGRTNRFDALDSVSFDRPAEHPDFRAVYDGAAEPLLLKRGETVRARLSFFRLHGSHGEIVLAVTKACPGTTWAFEPLVVHSGVPHAELVIKADEDAPPAYHFAVQVVAVPRHKTAGRHEREVTVPVSIVVPDEDEQTGQEEPEEPEVGDEMSER